MKLTLRIALVLAPLAVLHATDPAPAPIHETFGADFNAKHFITPIPNKNTQVRDGVLWTHGTLSLIHI